MIFCTAGHVDHGKTALVRALTGVDTDRLAEERRRGLTIELGFAPLELPGVGRVSLVDVPGHAQFIPTMLSGCGGLDGALFTVAADEGPMPQTAEHLDILSLLGLERGVVALTRADLASPAARAEVEARTRALTAGTFLEGAPRIFVSAVTGEGLEALRAALAAMARQAPPPPEGSPRLHVDRVFSVDGSGTVVTGTLTGGPLRRGDRVQLYPGGQTARVRGLQCHGVPAEALPPGVRAAVNLAGVRLRDVGRGDTLAAPGALALTDRTDVSLRVLPDAPFPVHTGSQLHFHHGARALVCRFFFLGQVVLRPGEAGWAQLRFTQPAAAAPGDRFVARFFSPLATVGGGVLVDLAPPGKGRMRPERLARLAALAEGRPLLAAESPAAPAAPAAPAPSAEAEGELEALYLGYGLEPPPWARVEPRFAGRIREARRACRRLKERGVLLELSPGHLLRGRPGGGGPAARALRPRPLFPGRGQGCPGLFPPVRPAPAGALGRLRRHPPAGRGPDFFHICLTRGGKPAMMGVDMGAEGPLVGPPVFKTDGDGAPVLVCSIRTRPRHGLRTALLARGSAGMAKPLSRAGRFFASNRDPRCWARGWGAALRASVGNKAFSVERSAPLCPVSHSLPAAGSAAPSMPRRSDSSAPPSRMPGWSLSSPRTAARWADSPAMEPPAQPSIWGPAQPPSSTRYMCTRMIWPWPRAPYRAPSDSSTEPPPQSGRRLCFSICSMLPAASAPSPPFQQQGGVEDHQHGAGVVNQGPHHGVEDAGHGQHDGH